MSVLTLLGNTLRKPDGSTVPTDEALVGKSVVAFYFSAHWCPPCRGFTPELCKRYTDLKAAGKDFEMIFVSSDRDVSAYDEYHKEMTFLAMPYALRDEKETLSKKFKVNGIPTLVFYDLKEDKVITTDGREVISEDSFIEDFPYKPVPFSMAMLGETIRSPGGATMPSSEALDKDVVGLYFSAHWCPPCRGFTPTLSEKYTALIGAKKSFELVFVSSDKNDEAFNEYADSMTFPALPYADRKAKDQLSKIFKVQGIPSLVFVDTKTGKVINGEARGAISSDTFIEDFPYHPKAMYDLSESTTGINDEICLLVLMEAAGAEKQKELSALLLEFATEEAKKPEDDRIRCFTGKGGGPVGRVRQLCHYPAIVGKHAHLLETKDAAGGWGCDGCGKKGAARFRCTKGCDFDYCGDCNEQAGATTGEAAEPVLLLMDFGSSGAHYHPLPEHKAVTRTNIAAFVQAFKDMKLTKLTPDA